MTKQAYLSMMKPWSRAELLRCCRQAGVTAHRLPTEKLPELLWDAIGQYRYAKEETR